MSSAAEVPAGAGADWNQLVPVSDGENMGRLVADWKCNMIVS